MNRAIRGFHQDEAGEWVAELSCFHNQHVRDPPPSEPRPWVLKASERAKRIGTETECALCDRAELPDGLVVLRTLGPWTNDTLPRSIQLAHRVPGEAWGILRVLHGVVAFTFMTKVHPQGSLTRLLQAGDSQAIPPGVAHYLVPHRPVMVELDLLQPPGYSPSAET